MKKSKVLFLLFTTVCLAACAKKENNNFYYPPYGGGNIPGVSGIGNLPGLPGFGSFGGGGAGHPVNPISNTSNDPYQSELKTLQHQVEAVLDRADYSNDIEILSTINNDGDYISQRIEQSEDRIIIFNANAEDNVRYYELEETYDLYRDLGYIRKSSRIGIGYDTEYSVDRFEEGMAEYEILLTAFDTSVLRIGMEMSFVAPFFNPLLYSEVVDGALWTNEIYFYDLPTYSKYYFSEFVVRNISLVADDKSMYVKGDVYNRFENNGNAYVGVLEGVVMVS